MSPKPSNTMKISSETIRVFVASLLVVVFQLLQPAAMANPPVEDPPSGAVRSANEVGTMVSRVTDPMLRDALGELLRNALAHTPPTQGVGDTEEVMKICRSSQRVYCNFLGVQATSTVQTIKMNKEVIKEVYGIALGRLHWITVKEIKHDDLVKSVESIKDKYTKMGLDAFAKTAKDGRVEVVTTRNGR